MEPCKNTAWASGNVHPRRRVHGKLLGGHVKGKEDSGERDLTRFLPKTGQCDQASPGGHWRMRNRRGIKSDLRARVGSLAKQT
jgi:hypothetical protein